MKNFKQVIGDFFEKTLKKLSVLLLFLVLAGIFILSPFAGLNYIGTFLLGIVLYPFIRMFIKYENNENEKQLSEKEDSIKMLEKKLEDIKIQQRSELVINEIKPILKLNCLTMEIVHKRMFDESVEIEGEKVIKDVTSKTKLRFLGYYVSTFIANYGIDLSKVKVLAKDDDRILYVIGAEPRFTSIEDHPKSECETFILLEKNKILNKWVVQEKDYRANQTKDHYFKVFIDEINEHRVDEIKMMKKPLQDVIIRILGGLFLNRNWEIRLVEEEHFRLNKGDEFISLLEFIELEKDCRMSICMEKRS